jgi:hypothetical protein
MFCRESQEQSPPTHKIFFEIDLNIMLSFTPVSPQVLSSLQALSKKSTV